VDELLDPAVGEAAEEAWPLAVVRHALEGVLIEIIMSWICLYVMEVS
jgi:hypothetical protein